ncbi:signal recognition particle-docking protein FtsY [Neorhodopirellula pilleata]|uniref:Signal recognition particle receptor FtsY n=1 Tax=Neorhodopirellula pilleata TaxID=2714738 RepID=A0A5C6AWL6_9BACT|nr:signal recognition particle-docking protein FtsY [Neorhodopirellula pilleata]TWU03539.1 Signal recognition particle receptor FtsY [Neorhodopirellula pilleata]
MAFWRSKKSDPDPTPPAATTGSGDAEPTIQPVQPRGSGGVLAKITGGLNKTRRVLATDIRDLFKSEGRLVDEEFLGELFARLIRTDMGIKPANLIKDEVAKKFRGRVVQLEEVIETITDEIRQQLRQDHGGLAKSDSPPTVILVVGVNGSGKTTSIGKLAHLLHSQGHSLVLGAGDTFRAAAVEQLTIWAGRIGCEIVTGASGADPASVAYQTVDKAISLGTDYAIIDTAGRLQTQSNLMQELQKIRKVIDKRLPGGPHEVLLVLDATAGQNAISQAKGFSEAARCTGIVLAKLDGSAKGGVVLPIRDQFQLPVKFVGLGEGMQDMAAFDPDSFAEALLKG